MSSVAEPPAQVAVQKVFICYRREETGAHAGRIYDAMVARFGEENVFMDLELAPGVDFVDRITEVVSGCLALIIVMGPHWSTVEDATGRRRLDDPEDFVRLEVQNALRRNDVTPIPVLVGGAQMPRPDELPPEMRPLTRRNALEMSDGRWRYDVDRLMSTLDELLPDGAKATPQPPPPLPEQPPPPSLGWRVALEGALVAGITAFFARFVGQAIPNPAEANWKAVVSGVEVPDEESAGEKIGHIAGIAGRRTETFALVGGALAIWLARRIWRIYPLRHLLRGLLVGGLAGLVGGLIWGAAVYLPDHTVPLDTRSQIDLLATAVSGGILGSLIGWSWHPRRTGPAILGGALGGFLFALFLVITHWQSTATGLVALRFGLGAAAIAGVALAVLILGDRTETRAGPGAG
ncbi:MAG TPA: TIR domain-containing protein [Solirubrobacterales bacterium]|nr:TIR domain-containing protein [Solirubrobacterales bacterium]